MYFCRYNPIWKIIDARWNVQLHRPLHAAAYYLNPQFQYNNPTLEQDTEVHAGLYDCIERMVHDRRERVKIEMQMDAFRNARGLFGREIAKSTRHKKAPGELFIFGYLYLILNSLY